MDHVSFIILIEKSWFEECLNNVHSYVKHLATFAAYPDTVFGIDCMVIEGFDGFLDAAPPHSFERGKKSLADIKEDYFEEFEKEISKKTNKIFLLTFDQEIFYENQTRFCE